VGGDDGGLTIPAVVAAWRCQRKGLDRLTQYVVLGLCTMSLLFVVDTLFNAMINQVFFMLCGALVSIAEYLKNVLRPGASSRVGGGVRHDGVAAGGASTSGRMPQVQ